MDDGRISSMVEEQEFRRLRAIVRAIAHPNRAPSQFLLLSGKRMSLKIVDHLKFVLHIAQEHICNGEIILLLI